MQRSFPLSGSGRTTRPEQPNFARETLNRGFCTDASSRALMLLCLVRYVEFAGPDCQHRAPCLAHYTFGHASEK